MMPSLPAPRSRNRACYVVAVAITIAAGLASRHFPQYLPACLGKYPGDTLWALMVFLGLGILFRQTSSLRLGLIALGFSFTMETLKLYQPPWLENIRQTLPGQLVLGRGFFWQDFVAYTIGVLFGLILERPIAGSPRAAKRSPAN